MCWLKAHGQLGLDRYGSPVHGVRLELPLLHAVDGGACKNDLLMTSADGANSSKEANSHCLYYAEL